MVVLILENVPRRLSGELSRWFLEPKAGVLVGKVSAMVRDRVWEKACRQVGNGGCLMIHDTNTERGLRTLTCGQTSRSIEDFDGLALARIP